MSYESITWERGAATVPLRIERPSWVPLRGVSAMIQCRSIRGARVTQKPRAVHEEPQPAEWPILEPAQTHLSFPLEPQGLTAETTPVRDLFVLAHLGVPQIDPDGWSLTIGGLVRRPIELHLAELEAMPQETLEACVECAGNPATPTVPARLVGNVTWRGVDLRTVLDAAGVEPQARFVWSYGLDRGEFLGVPSGPYLKDLPLERVAAGGVLIAFEMNGEPLTPEHGFPARLAVPGYYGTNSVKWLYHLELAQERAVGPFTTTFYNDVVSGEGADRVTRPVWNIAPESVIVSPAPGTALTRAALPESLEVWGWAWGDAGIAHVEVSVDGGRVWSAATLAPRHERSWQRFRFDWRPRIPEGATQVELQCRATDARGQTQPLDGARNAVHKVTLEIAAAAK